MDLRDVYIERVAKGRSFAEVGGLWGTVNEKVSVASARGAKSVAMIDISPPESELWQRFHERVGSLGVTECDCISGDICNVGSHGGRKFDVVHCSGVLYHHPNPVFLIECLKRITGQFLILTSAVMHEEITNEFGTYRLPSSGAIFIPSLNEGERKILWDHWSKNAGVEMCHGISEPPPRWDPQELGPWWWLFPPRVMLAMAGTVGFRVIEDGPIWNGNAHTALLEVAS